MKIYEKIHNIGSWRSHFSFLFTKNFKRWLLVVSLFAFASAFIAILVARYLDLSFTKVSISNFKLDEIAPEDFVVTRDIFYNNVKATETRRKEKEDLVLPVFRLARDTAKESLADFDLFVSILTKNVHSGARVENIASDLLSSVPSIKDSIGSKEIASLITLASGREIIFSSARALLQEVMYEGICTNIDEIAYKNPGLFKQGKILLSRYEHGNEERSLASTLTMGDIQRWVEREMRTSPLNEVGRSLVIMLFTSFAKENCFFDEEATDANRKKARDDVSPTMEHLIKGSIIIEKGMLVTQDVLLKIKAVEQSDISLNINNVISTFLILGIIYALGLFLFYKPVSGLRLKKNQIVLLLGIAFFYLILAIVFSKLWRGGEWLPFSILLPTSSIAILISILIATNIGALFTLVLSLIILLITQMNVYAFLFAFFSGIAGCLAALRTEKRIDLIFDGLFLAAANAFLIFFFGMLSNVNMTMRVLEISFGALNGFFCGIFSLGFLPIFEIALNSATRFRLMELSDINAPILKKLLTVAPGTYNHSMVMANLAETACEEIGANSLLARVASYYHDIGKIDSPSYFIENQKSQNVHDELRPTLSVSIIKSHVKIGIEKARELGLPKEVIDIIAQHHGKSLMKYFYQRALDEKGAKISPDDFKYPGEQPKSKEAGVVMLADVVEAASRTLKRPTVGKLEKLIWKIIMEKFTSGELNECSLTLTDLDTIKKSFLQILTGHFHSRIEYPMVKENAT